MTTRVKKYLMLFVTINIFFIFSLIYKQSRFTKISYEQQLLEQQRNNLRNEEQELTQQLYQLKNPKEIKNYAIKKLGMKKMALRQAKKISAKNGLIIDEG